MTKSLIKTVDGIGIWVADTTTESHGLREQVALVFSIILAIALDIIAWGNGLEVIMFPILDFVIVIIVMLFGYMLGILFRSVPAYNIYPESDVGVIIFKTPDDKADQLAICKAAKEIEATCHEIAEKRRKLDHIAEFCK